MRNLELHYQDYMRESQDSQLFGPGDRMQVEEDYSKSTQHFDHLIRSMEKGNFDSSSSKQQKIHGCIKGAYNTLLPTSQTVMHHLSGVMVVRLKGELMTSRHQASV